MKHLLTIPALLAFAACTPAPICDDDPGTAKLDAVSDCRGEPLFKPPAGINTPRGVEGTTDAPDSSDSGFRFYLVPARDVGRDSNLDAIDRAADESSHPGETGGRSIAELKKPENKRRDMSPSEIRRLNAHNAARVAAHEEHKAARIAMQMPGQD